MNLVPLSVFLCHFFWTYVSQHLLWSLDTREKTFHIVFNATALCRPQTFHVSTCIVIQCGLDPFSIVSLYIPCVRTTSSLPNWLVPNTSFLSLCNHFSGPDGAISPVFMCEISDLWSTVLLIHLDPIWVVGIQGHTMKMFLYQLHMIVRRWHILWMHVTVVYYLVVCWILSLC